MTFWKIENEKAPGVQKDLLSKVLDKIDTLWTLKLHDKDEFDLAIKNLNWMSQEQLKMVEAFISNAIIWDQKHLSNERMNVSKLLHWKEKSFDIDRAFNFVS